MSKIKLLLFNNGKSGEYHTSTDYYKETRENTFSDMITYL